MAVATMVPIDGTPMDALTLPEALPSPEPAPGVPPGSAVPMRLGGKVYTFPSENYQAALSAGAVPLTDAEWTQHQTQRAIEKANADRREKYGDIGHQAEAAAVGAASGLSLGLSDAALRAVSSPETMEGVRQSIAENPISHGVGKGVGMVAPLALSGGAGAVAEGAEGAAALGEGAEALGALGGAAEASGAVRGAQAAAGAEAAAQAAPTLASRAGQALSTAGRVVSAPQHIVTSIGEKVERGIAAMLPGEAQGLAARLGTKAAALAGRGAAEGAVYGGSDYLSEQALSPDPELDGHKLLAAIGMGALFGFGTGGILGAAGEAGHSALGALSPSMERLANDAAASATTEGRQGGVAKKIADLPHEGFTDGKQAYGNFLRKNGYLQAGQTVTEMLPRAEAATEKFGAEVGSLRKVPDELGVQGVTAGQLHDAIDGVMKDLDPGMHRAARGELEIVKDYITRTAEQANAGAAEARAAQVVEASGAVKAARSAEGVATGNAANGLKALQAAEAREAQATANAAAAAEKLQAARIDRAAKAADVEAFAKPKSPKEFAEFIKTPEGQAKVEDFIRANPERAGLAVKPADLFPKVDAKVAKAASRAAKVAEAQEARAASQAQKAETYADAAKAERAARKNEADAFAEHADTARGAVTAAEEKAIATSEKVARAALDTPLTFEQLGKIRGTLDDKIRGWNRDPFGDVDMKGAAMKKARWALEEELTKAADAGMKDKGQPEWLRQYKAAKLNYRMSMVAEEAVTKAAQSRLKNRKNSLSDYLTGMGASHLAAGPIGAAAGIATAQAHRAIRERGPSTTAVLLDKLSAFGAIKRATDHVDQQIEKGVSAVLNGREKVSLKSPMHGLDTFEEKRDAVLQAEADMQGHQSGIVNSVSALAKHAPGVTSSFESAAMRATAYLASTLPRDKPLNPMMPKVNPIEPSDHEKRVWSRSVDTVLHPVGILADVANGTVTSEQVAALNATNAPVADAIRKKMTGVMATMTKPLSFKQLTGVSTLYGIPASPIYQNVDFYQKSIQPPPAPPPTGTPAKHGHSGSHSGKFHLASDVALTGQKSELA